MTTTGNHIGHLYLQLLPVVKSLQNVAVRSGAAQETVNDLTFDAPITTKVVCFSRLLKYLRSLYGKQCGPRSGAVCSGSTLFASILNSSVMLGNYLQQATSADDIFRCIIFLGALRVKFDLACTALCSCTCQIE